MTTIHREISAWPSVNAALAEVLEAAEAAHLATQVASLARVDATLAGSTLSLAGGVAAVTQQRFGRKLNHVCGAALNSPLELHGLLEVEARYAALGLATELDLCPYTARSAFALLSDRDYRVDGFSNTYWVDLKTSANAFEAAPHVDVRPPHPHELDAFVEWSLAGFAAQAKPRPSGLLRTLARSACSRDDTELFVAELDGAIAGTAAVSILPTTAGPVAHLFLASTLPQARNRGVQAALLTARTRIARERGARFAHITARPGTVSARNVERAGYRIAYTKLTLSHPPTQVR